MRKLTTGLLALAACFAAPAALAQDTIKIGIGVILPYSGQFADTGDQIDNGIKLYMKQHGDTVAGKKIEIIRKDVGGIAPDVAKRLAQELVVRDKVDILAGFALTPNALAAGDVSAEAKKFMVVMNAATSIITTKSPYMARTSLTTPQLNETLGAWAAKSGVKKAYTMVVGLRPRPSTPKARSTAASRRPAARSSARCACRSPIRISRPSCSAPRTSIRRRSSSSIPGGAQPAALGKALAERGIDPKKIKVMGQGELTDEQALKSMGDAALGIITACHYDYNHDSALNKDFVEGLSTRTYKPQPGHLLGRRL